MILHWYAHASTTHGLKTTLHRHRDLVGMQIVWHPFFYRTNDSFLEDGDEDMIAIGAVISLQF